MVDTNRSKSGEKVIWEISPENNWQIFGEITCEDIHPDVFYSDCLIKTANFPTLPYPLGNPVKDCLDRLWTQTTIKIKSIITEEPRKNQPIIEAINIQQNHKGLVCPFTQNRCQEGWCQGCCVYLDKG